MKLRFLNFFALASLIVSGFTACKSPESHKLVDNNTLLWKISGNGLEKASYLYGTIHVIPAKDFFLGKNVEEKLSEAENVVFEIDLDNLGDMMTLLQKTKLPDSLSLDQLMSPQDFEFVKSKMMEELDFSEKEFEQKVLHTKPIFVSQGLLEQLLSGEYTSYEMQFMQKAIKEKKEILGLEEVDDQLAAIDAIPLEEQVELLLKGLREDDMGLADLERLFDLYKQQQLDSLLTYMKKVSPEMMQYEQELLINRNKNWIPKIEKFARKGSSFIAVGAGHLPGETGVIQLLREAGFTVEPLALD